MADEGAHHRDRWSFRSVELRDDCLVEHRWLGDRVVPWLDVPGVRWVAPGEAEVLVRDGAPIRLPHGAELVAEVEQRAAAALARWQADGASPELVATWLALAGRRRRRVDPTGSWLALGLFSLLVGILVPDIAWRVSAFITTACLVAWALRHRLPAATLDATGVSTTFHGERRRIDWTDLRSVTVTRNGRGLDPAVRLELSDGTVTLWFEDGAQAMATIVDCASRVAAANTTVFRPAGPEPPPDTALSPARLADADAERGVSRTDDLANG